MVVNLQPIGMIHEVMEHRMAHQQADMTSLHESNAKMSRFARAALMCCAETATWLERDPSMTISVAEAVGQSVALLGRTFGFMGFKLINKVRDNAERVPRDAIRHALTAALLAAADTASGPADVVLSSTTGAHGMTLVLKVAAASDERSPQPFEEIYRRLGWDDVEAVAHVEAVGFARQGDGATLTFTG